MLTNPYLFIGVGLLLLGAVIVLRRFARPDRSVAVFGMIKQLPLLKDGSEFSVAANVRSKAEYKILIEHKSCQPTKAGVLANLAILDAHDLRVVGALAARLIGFDGKCTIPAQYGINRIALTFDIANGPAEIVREPADYMCLVTDKPNGNPFADLAEAILKDSYLKSKDGIASARRELVKAIHPDWGPSEDVNLRGEALMWANGQISKSQ